MELVNEWFPTGKFIKVDTPFSKYSTYEKELMDAIPLTGNSLSKVGMEYNVKFGHTLGQIQHLSIMNRIDICYTACCLGNQTVATAFPGIQGIKL